MREFRVTSCWFGKPVVEVERRCFVKLKRCVLSIAYGTSSEGVVSNALRLENQEVVAMLTCCKIPTGALLKETSSNDLATQIQQRRKFSSDANSAATQIQQRRKYSSSRFSDAYFIFSMKLSNPGSRLTPCAAATTTARAMARAQPHAGLCNCCAMAGPPCAGVAHGDAQAAPCMVRPCCARRGSARPCAARYVVAAAAAVRPLSGVFRQPVATCFVF
ncbi:putative disease resistance protein [Dorcoceras hygrometricum]|uniref:Putative disease resistance protein n=1 Tax=Dorcoceras hygrometricum TaxID=472368 RepID=A0A2Z7C0M3_9LAMI|nr:putative disease resistance protein [Dorcoceras hygrometricum]